MLYGVFALILLGFNLVKMDYYLEDFVLLYPLQGEWTMPFKDGSLVETWEKKYNKLLEGKTIYLKDDDSLTQENITLNLKDGRIYYTPSVNGRNDGETVPFTLIEIDNKKFIFQNKEYDFPQRIIYELRSANELVATIEGETAKGFRKIEYKFKRKKNNF